MIKQDCNVGRRLFMKACAVAGVSLGLPGGRQLLADPKRPGPEEKEQVIVIKGKISLDEMIPIHAETSYVKVFAFLVYTSPGRVICGTNYKFMDKTIGKLRFEVKFLDAKGNVLLEGSRNEDRKERLRRRNLPDDDWDFAGTAPIGWKRMPAGTIKSFVLTISPIR